MKPRVLLISRQPSLAGRVRAALNASRCLLRTGATPAALWRALARANGPHVAIISQAGLGADLQDLLPALRRDPRGAALCVLLLASADDEAAVLRGFELGADDVMPPPWSYPEMGARVLVMLRRVPGVELDHAAPRVEGVSFSAEERRLSIGARHITLTQNESSIITKLMARPGRTVSRGELLKSLWNTTEKLRTRCVDVHIGHLRRKLSRSSCRIITVRPLGYRLDLA